MEEDRHSLDGESLIEALRGIGGERLSPRVGAPSLGEDNFDVLRRAREPGVVEAPMLSAQNQYEELKRQHQVDLNDAKQLADLEDPGLQDHMSRARQQLADHERLQAELPSTATMQRDDTAARRTLSKLMTSLQSQQTALQVAGDAVLLQAANAQKLADGGHPHGYPTPEGLTPAAHLAKCCGVLSKKVAAAGEELAQVATALEATERDLTLARRSYEQLVDGLLRRSLHCEKAHGGQ